MNSSLPRLIPTRPILRKTPIGYPARRSRTECGSCVTRTGNLAELVPGEKGTNSPPAHDDPGLRRYILTCHPGAHLTIGPDSSTPILLSPGHRDLVQWLLLLPFSIFSLVYGESGIPRRATTHHSFQLLPRYIRS